jgi:esterase/lipase
MENNKIIKKIGFGVTVIFCLWLIASIYLTFSAPSLIFNNKITWSPSPQYGYKLSFIKNSKNQNISIWTFENPTTDNYVIYLHGNAGRLSNFFPELYQKANVVSPAYPGYHESEGKPSVENVYETAELTYDYLVKMGIREDKITILGHSMGGSPAVYLASKKPKAKKLILVNTFSSIQSMCFRSYSILCGFSGNIFNSARNAEKITIPVRQFAYKNDLTVPYKEGETLYTYFKNSSDKKFVQMEKFTHSYPDFDLIRAEL